MSGVASDFSEARAINAAGRIGGASTSSPGVTSAFLKPPVIGSTSTFQNIGLVGGTYAVVTSVNNRGQAVGWGYDSLGQSQGFIYLPNGTIQTLDAFLYYSGWHFTGASMINDDGSIVGTALYFDPSIDDWLLRGYVVTPQ